MEIDPNIVSPKTVYATMIRAITPRPIAWVSTRSENGVTNLAPFSYFSGVCSQPAALMFSPVNKPDGTLKDTVRNIIATRQFVVNVVPFQAAESMLMTAFDFDFETSEFDKVGLTEKPSVRVDPPGVERILFRSMPSKNDCRNLLSTSIRLLQSLLPGLTQADQPKQRLLKSQKPGGNYGTSQRMPRLSLWWRGI